MVHSIWGGGPCPQGVVHTTEKELDLEGEPALEQLQLSPASDLEATYHAGTQLSAEGPGGIINWGG